MPDKGHSRCRTYRRSAAKRDTAAIFQITPGSLGYAARARARARSPQDRGPLVYKAPLAVTDLTRA